MTSAKERKHHADNHCGQHQPERRDQAHDIEVWPDGCERCDSDRKGLVRVVDSCLPLNMRNINKMVCAFRIEVEIVRSTTIGKDECHVVEFLHRKSFDILMHLGDIHIHGS